MSLELPPNFKNDIQGRDTNLVPVVVIGRQGTAIPYPDFLAISTNVINVPIYVSDYGAVDTNTKPLLLNIPSLKESIDIEKRNYKISSINLDISNLPYNGNRFSEIVSGSLINQPCRVFWVSQSATQIWFIDTYDAPGAQSMGSAAMQIYSGNIRRYTHDDKKVRLVVEDRSQATLHKDLPLEKNYLTGDGVPDKYKNKPIPMVYGHVDKSPCVIDAGKIIKIDSQNITELVSNTNTAFSETISPLLINVDDSYLPILKTIEADLGSMVAGVADTGDEGDISLSAEGAEQWIDPGTNPNIALISNLLVNNNVLQCKLFHKPASTHLGKYDINYDENSLSVEQTALLVDNDYST